MKEIIRIESKVSKKNLTLKTRIKNAGIIYPHPSLGFFASVYAPIEEANKNKVRLSKEAVKESLAQLVGTQVNLNHYRENWIIGTILDAWINAKKEIEIAFSFYKSVYPNLYEQAMDLLEKGELTVSFELRVAKDDIELLADGTRRLHKVEFDGVGLLMGTSPAYPGAIVYEQAQIEKLYTQDLIFAKNLQDQNKEEDTVDKKTNEKLLAKQKEIVISEFGEDAIKDWSDEDFCNEEKINTLRESLKAKEDKDESSEKSEEQADKEEKKKEDSKAEEKTEEAKEENENSEEASESKDEETSEEQASYKCECLDCGKVFTAQEHCKDTKCPECGGQTRRKDRPGPGQKASNEEVAEEDKESEEAKKTTITEKEKIKTERTYDDEKNEETVKQELERTVERDGEKVVKEKVNREITYSAAEVEQIKSDYEDKLKEKDGVIAQKDKRIKFLEENANSIAELKAELGDFVKDFTDEDFQNEIKVENARLKKEIADLKGTDLETAEEEDKDSEPENDKDIKATNDENKAEEAKKDEEPEESKEELVEIAIKERNKKK